MPTRISGAVAGDRIKTLFLVATLRNVNRVPTVKLFTILRSAGNKQYATRSQLVKIGDGVFIFSFIHFIF